MNNETFKIVNEKFYKGLPGQALLINAENIRGAYQYIGLWYARDGNDKTLITTEVYYSTEKEPKLPLEYNMELKENNFKKVKKFELDLNKKWIWITTRIDNNKYCRLKTGKEKQGRLYINYKVIHNKAYGFDVLANGIFKGGNAYFFPLGSEDMTGDIDYTDAIFYIVMLKDMPPADWGIADTFLGAEHLPVFSPTFKFTDNREYTNWFEQNPLEKVKK